MIRPPVLMNDSKVVIVSPAGNVEPEYVMKAAAILCEWGLKVETGANVYAKTGRFSGFVEQRLTDLQSAMDDPDVKLILCSRGGYGSVHLLDKLNFDGIVEHPKWLVGFSDITALHAALQSKGIMSVHGPMAKHFADEGPQDLSLRYIKALLAGQKLKYEIPVSQRGYLNRVGRASGRIFGGNLSVLSSTLGTRFNKVPNGGILFIEDIGEVPYRVDRLIYHLKLAGVLNKISGLIVGQFTDYVEDNEMYSDLKESIRNAVNEFDFPVCFDFPVGHVKLNFPMVMGARASLSVRDDMIILKQ